MDANAATNTKTAAIKIGIAMAATTTLGASAAIVSALASSCSQPSSSGDGGTDSAVVDAPRDIGVDSAPPDSSAACDAGTVTSDWTGWHRLAGANACCTIDVPDDPIQATPPLAWVPCTNGAPNCQQMDAQWPLGPLAPYRFGDIKVTVDSQGNPKWLWFTRSLLTDTIFEDDLYNLANSAPIEAWRGDVGSTPWCALDTRVTPTKVVLLELGPSVVATSSGDPVAMATAPSFSALGGLELLPQEVAASDSVLGFDLEPEGVIVQNAIGSSNIAETTNTAAGLQLVLELVTGSDVYASSAHGSAGYGQEYKMNPDGSFVLFRSNSTAHASAMRTDGTSLFWVETHGSTNVNAQQQSAEVWAAPYTNDPTTLVATATKVSTVPVSMPWIPSEAVAFTGLYVARYDSYNAIITRLSDGASLTVSPGPNRFFWSLALVTPTELWATVGEGKLHGSALVRIQLPAW